MNKSNVALIVLFNHRYDKNLPILEELYRERFTNRYYLVPFYDGNMQNVIPVYGRSIFFETYIAQGANVFFKEQYKHYLFVADDMVLNPSINEENYSDFFEVGEGQSFIPDLRPLQNFKKYWIGTMSALLYRKEQKYIETKNEFLSYDDALQKMKRQDVVFRPLSRAELFGKLTFKMDTLANKARLFLRVMTFLCHPFKRKYALPYPCVGSYSDIVLVSSDSLRQFAHYCGLFGATCLFAEVAIPTALVLSSDKKIITERHTQRKGRSFWKSPEAAFWTSDESDVRNLRLKYKNLDDILANFPNEYLYMHPIKLSQWAKR